MAGPKRTPKSSTADPPSSLKKSNSSSNQSSILGFFQKNVPSRPAGAVSSTNSTANGALNGTQSERARLQSSKPPPVKYSSSSSLTPAPSSDALEPPGSPDEVMTDSKEDDRVNGLPSPVTPAVVSSRTASATVLATSSSGVNSPSRKVKKAVNYAESENEDGAESEESFEPIKAVGGRRASKRQRTVVDEDSEDAFDATEVLDAEDDDDMDDFLAPDDSEEEAVASKKRKRSSKGKNQKQSSPLPLLEADSDDALHIPSASTAQQWTYDPENPKPLNVKSDARINALPRQSANGKKWKEKAHTSEPEQRYPWLATIMDADRNSPGHPDYDPRTVYIPPLAWSKFSPFEKQYWEIKQKLWDTIVFFKKGKFYELYENDATIGHQLFDLKLTDRVNMRMVGVPEMSLALWANQFVAKGFKIARVDQQESALAKEMRERDDTGAKKGKEDKVIRRELACVLTAGTLVDGGMLQDDMSTYCVAIKEAEADGLPIFGISFVDTATGQFFLSQFADDVDLTKFETFVAQTRPQEILLEKSCISVKALRVLKNNTGPTTLWNYLKPGKEFLTADIAIRDLDTSDYFVSEDQENLEVWPKALREAREQEHLMSSFGALVHYLRTLKIERDLITLGNFTWYDPIKKATSLVLDGQTLINLEIFANNLDGSAEGTLFTLLNRCVTPFGKRLFRQWVCHPLYEIIKINNRLDAVDALNADGSIRDQFTSALTKLPDLERLISRIHAGFCKAQDFVKVLEGFEQIEYTMSLMSMVGTAGEGVIGQLVSAMPDLDKPLVYWKTAFDRKKARESGVLVPERGVEEDFDASQDTIEGILAELQSLLKKYRRELGSSAIEYRDNGKEIYQLEVPIKVKGIPKNWNQMSATQKVKRYYSPELRTLVRKLQEAQETHSQIVKEVASRFHARFDEDYQVWLAAVKIVAQLDCLISLAKASSALGEPSCRPIFVEEERSVIEFEELRHPCMLPNVSDFIPNDISLGGTFANINLLTGANAAGKSTILRMTCVAVIMAQLGCYVPCTSARLTPVDRIMSRLGANDNIFAAQSTFFVELSETKKILSEATPRSLVILDELGRGTSSYDGVAVAQAVLHHIASHVSCTGFFATHYHSLPPLFAFHSEIAPKRMRIQVDDTNRKVTFLYKLEEGVAEGSFGMHCASMCGIPAKIVESAESVARDWERGRKERLGEREQDVEEMIPLGVLSDVAWALRGEAVEKRGFEVLMEAVARL